MSLRVYVWVIRKVTNTPTKQTMQYFVFMFCRYIATFVFAHVFDVFEMRAINMLQVVLL